MNDFREDLKKAKAVLENGGVILYPTDTIWGIGCDATNEAAVKKVYAIKKREDTKSMLVLLGNELRLRNYVSEVPETAYDLIELSEKPLTIIYDGARNLAKNLIASDGSIGIRITRETFSKQLTERFKKPLVSTSANISGELPPGKFDDISQEIKDAVDYIVQYRQEETEKASPSGIIKLSANGEVKIIRE